LPVLEIDFEFFALRIELVAFAPALLLLRGKAVLLAAA
jgi:hypothetical protein